MHIRLLLLLAAGFNQLKENNPTIYKQLCVTTVLETTRSFNPFQAAFFALKDAFYMHLNMC